MTSQERECREIGMDAFIAAFPRLFHGEPLFAPSFVPEGWTALVSLMLSRMDETLLAAEAEALRLLQIKEKLGALRVYWRFQAPLDVRARDEHPNAAIRQIVDAAEAASKATCVSCGAGRATPPTSSLLPRCPTCR